MRRYWCCCPGKKRFKLVFGLCMLACGAGYVTTCRDWRFLGIRAAQLHRVRYHFQRPQRSSHLLGGHRSGESPRALKYPGFAEYPPDMPVDPRLKLHRVLEDECVFGLRRPGGWQGRGLGSSCTGKPRGAAGGWARQAGGSALRFGTVWYFLAVCCLPVFCLTICLSCAVSEY